MSTKNTDNKQDYDRIAQFQSTRPASVCAPIQTSVASVGWLGPKVDGTGEDVVACTPIRPTLTLPQPIQFPARTPSHVNALASQLSFSEHGDPPNVDRLPSACSTTRAPAIRYTSTRPSAHTGTPTDTTPSVNTLLHKYERPSITPTSPRTTPASITSAVKTTPSACMFSIGHTAPKYDTLQPAHACRSSLQDGGVGGDQEWDPMVGLLYDRSSPHPWYQRNPSFELLQPGTKGTSPPEISSSSILKSTASPPPPPPLPPPPLPPTSLPPPPSCTAASPKVSGDLCPTTNTDVTCPEQNKEGNPTLSAKLGKEHSDGGAGEEGRNETRISAVRRELPPHLPSTSKFKTTREVTTPITTEVGTGSTNKFPVVPAAAIGKDAHENVPNEDVKLLTRKLHHAEEKIHALRVQMEHQALQIEGLQGLYDSKARENKQLKRRLRDQCLHPPPTASAMPPSAGNYSLGGNLYETEPGSAVNSGMRNMSYSELDPALNIYYCGENTRGTSSGLSSYNDYRYGNDYENRALGHGHNSSSACPDVYPMPNTVDALQERLSALHLQNRRLSSSLREEKMKRSEMEDVVKRERGYIKRLEDSLEEMSKTRVVMDPSTYQQVAQAYIASRRPNARRKHEQPSTYPGHLECDLASTTQKGSI